MTLSLEDLRAATQDVLRESIGPYRRVALVDFPLHRNAGDSLIWLGEVSYLEGLGYDIAYRSDRERFSIEQLRSAIGDGPALFHGGGNFGDLWPQHQDFRERAIPQLHRNPVIILSQSVYFEDTSNAERANRILRDHPNLTLLVREGKSLERARTQLPDVAVAYCHDMALGFSEQSEVPPTHRYAVVGIDRADHEKADFVPFDEGWYITDWEMSNLSRLRWVAMQKSCALSSRRGFRSSRLYRVWVQGLYDKLARLCVREAITTLKHGRVVVTNRLHAHILSGLLGIPNVAMDNSYGKVSSIFYEYSGELFKFSELASTPKAARDAVLELVVRKA